MKTQRTKEEHPFATQTTLKRGWRGEAGLHAALEERVVQDLIALHALLLQVLQERHRHLHKHGGRVSDKNNL